MTLRVAIVGSGKISDGHVEEINKLRGLAELVAVCDREGVMAEQLASRFKVPNWYDDFGKLLQTERPDVVHIATPPATHWPLAKMAIEAGAHVLVEKPLTLDYADSEKLITLAAERKRLVTIGYSYHFEPPAEELRALLARGVLGDVVHLESTYGYNLDGPFGRALLGDPRHWVHGLPGKLIHNVIDHALDKIAEFFDEDRPTLHAFGSLRRSKRYGDVRDELADELRVVVRGAKTTAYITFSAHARPVGHSLRVFGTKNTANLDFNARTVTLEHYPSIPSALGRLFPAFESAADFAKAGGRNLARFGQSKFNFFAGLGELIRRFYVAIESGGAPPIPMKDLLRVSWMMDGIFRQVRADLGRTNAQTNGSEAARGQDGAE